MSSTAAQNYCRQNYGDLATITTEEEFKEIVQVTGQTLVWIGLNRTAPNVDIWQWPEGNNKNFTKWSSTEPDGKNTGENCVVMDQNGWRDTSCGGSFFFTCSRRIMLVKENKTWEKALQHCRTQYTCLAFVDLEKKLTIYKTLFEIESKQSQTVRVWTGLRFLDEKWFWVNKEPLGSLVSLPQCPIQPYRCGAYNLNTSVWENRDCSEELNFLCYQ